MSRINTNVQSLIAQRTLTQNQANLGQSLERLSTGLRINRGKDDPAGLIASQRLDSEAKGINAAIGNANRADQVVNIAEGGLNEVSGLLTELQGLVTNTANSAGLSEDEKKANQLQIDSILQTIDRVSGATAFQGKRLLNGTLDYTTSTVAAGVTSYKVNGAKLSGGAALAVQAIVTKSAQTGGLYLSTGATLNLGGSSTPFSIEVGGAAGSRQFSFASGTTIAAIATAINSFKSVTGVSAKTSGTGGIKLSSTDYGSNQFVSVKTINAGGITGTGIGIFDTAATNFNLTTGSAIAFNSSTATNGKRDLGQDVAATINGIVATANGKTARINSDFLDVELTLSTGTSQALGTTNALTITGGGADFQLAGNVDIAGKVSLGVGNIAIRNLGSATNAAGGLEYLSSIASGQANNVVSSSDLTQAQKIISNAVTEVSTLRGRLGAFQKNTIGATVRSLGVALENTSAAESSIKDANFAEETASLTRNQILVQAATNVLGLANQAPQSALSLLRG
jgi:flagellin